MTRWQKPEFIEICMNAEIGAYQEDPGPDRETDVDAGSVEAHSGLAPLPASIQVSTSHVGE